MFTKIKKLKLTFFSVANFVGMSAQAYSSNMSVMVLEVTSRLTLVPGSKIFKTGYS
ncbi:hypothetical protein [Clostridium arbusti]|jgi:uncharacterized sodium:solute symporter family permease YidK|uniref:hypothetical protein n=1 Tax=Clostridium arbusti TaxID=1137848 RepID=UPI00031479DE|nr:hypothetical protein [Clostridium arbusti]